MRFKKDDLNMWINCYGSLKEDGLSLKEIEKYFLDNFGLKDISSIRKNYDILYRNGKVYINQDENSLKAIANAKADLLVNRKINIQMNKDLHRVANDEAKWQIIEDYLKNYKHPTYKIDKPKTKKIKVSDKDVIYIVGDIHYRGPQDRDLVVSVFNDINMEVLFKDYRNVTLLLTGDNIDGEIHNEQQRTNSPVIEQTVEITNLLVECINCNPAIKQVYMVYGNHEEIRLWGDKGTENNVAKFIYSGLKNCLKYAKIEAGNELLFDYKGKKVLLMHGHQNYAKSKAKIEEHCITTYNLIPEYIILGHFHTSKTNQFSKNHWLITAPAVKNWESNWDLNNGYCGLGQYIKLKLNFNSPQITTLDVKC